MTWNRNTEKIQEYNSRYKAELDGYKAFAMDRQSRRVHRQEQLTDKLRLLEEYIQEKQAINKPFTVAGILLKLGYNNKLWCRIRDGEYDHLLEEYISLNNIQETDVMIDDYGYPIHINQDGEVVTLIPYSLLHEKASMLIQEQREEACSSLRGNPAGNIFLLKAQMGFQEQDSPSTVNQTLVIADSEQAKKAISLLK